MKIKIIDIYSESGEELSGTGCPTCEYFETYDITSVEIQEVGTDNAATVEFDNNDETVIYDWKFPDWVKFNDWLNATEFTSDDPITFVFKNAIRYWKERYYGKK